MKLFSILVTFLLFGLSVNAQPIFNNPGPITICVNGSYYLNPSTTSGTFSSTNASVATVNSSGYVTGVANGSTTVQFVASDGTATAIATVTVNTSDITPVIIDGQSSYRFNGSAQGPTADIFMGYNGFNYSSTTRPINTGFYRSNNVSGSEAGCPIKYYIIKCDACGGTVSEYSIRPQGTLSGNTNGTGQLTYTSSNGGGPFTIVYQATGASPVTVNNISSTVAFNVVTPTTTTTYKLISVTDESTNASTDFSGTSATITVPLRIGDSYQGGKIFYIDGTGQHGLIAATSDQSNWIHWYNGSDITTGATATAIGTGLANTTTIISIQGATATDYAAGLARAYNGGGYTDWYLPSKDELSLMYFNIGKGASSPNYNIGGFATKPYWSSTESAPEKAGLLNFNNGFQGYNFKVNIYNVRAIRSF